MCRHSRHYQVLLAQMHSETHLVRLLLCQGALPDGVVLYPAGLHPEPLPVRPLLGGGHSRWGTEALLSLQSPAWREGVQ